MRLRQLFEAKTSEVAIIFGRFNPPHMGHKAAWELASKSPVWFVGTNQSTVGPKDPLPYDVKVKAMKAVWPEVESHIVAETSWLTMASKVYEQYPKATLLCLTDEDWVTKTIKDYNGKEGPHGYYNFAEIKQKPTPRLSSATALRDAVIKGDRDAFSKAAGVDADTLVDGKPFFDLVAEYLLPYADTLDKIKTRDTALAKKKKKAEAEQTEGVAEGSDFFAGSKFADEEGNTFSVEKIIAFAKKNPKYFRKDFPLSKIKHDLSWWQGNKERMMNADTSFPLLVIQNDDGHLGVADGLNRMKKAVDVEKKQNIDVYLVPKKDIMKFSEKQGVAEAEIPSMYSKQVPPGMEHRARYKCPNCGIANKVQDWAANDNECPTCLEPLPHGSNQMPLKYQGVAEGSLEEGVNDPHTFKCIFLFGPMGAGKSTVARPLLTHTGLRSVNLDNFNELFVKKGQVPTGHLSPDQLEKSWELTQKQQQNFIDGRLGVIIDGSGRNPSTAIGVIEKLAPMGYEFMMIFVNVSEATSIARQQSRAEKQKQQWGAGRQVDPELAKNTYAQVQKNLDKYSAYFGPQRFVYVDNENTPDLTQATKKVEAFLRAPIRQPEALAWIQSQKGGDKVAQQQKKLGTAQDRQQQARTQFNPLNPKFAKKGMGEGLLNEFAPGAGDEGGGEDPYKYPKPESYRRSADYFGRFEADHFDREDFDDDTGVFKGYWGSTQIAYFKFNDPAQTGGDDPGMGWYYEPASNGNSDTTSTKPAVDRSKERKQQELSMINAFLKSGQKAKPGSQIGRLMKKYGMAEGRRDYDDLRDTGFGRPERDMSDESNLLYIYKDGRVKQRMVSNTVEREARAEGFRDTPEQALKMHGIIKSKFKPGKWVQKQGTQWVEVFPFGEPATK